jgi:hypothetical protein
MKKIKRFNKLSKDGNQSCPKGKYWVRPHERKRITKGGKVYIQKVKGYCCSSHCLYQKIADEEKIVLRIGSIKHLF